MSGRFPRKPVSPSQPAQGVSPALFRQQRLWMKLATYRPLAVLAGIWIALVAIALLAYGQLLQTTPEPAKTEPEPQANVYPHERVEGDAVAVEAAPAPSRRLSEEPTSDRGIGVEDEPKPADAVNAGLSIWTIAALVGTCALGCWVISVRLQTPPRPRRKKQKAPPKVGQPRLASPVKAKPSPAGQKPKPPNTPQRLGPYDPSQPLVAEAKPSYPPRQTPGPAQTHPPTTQAPANVTVVSEEMQHRLDWPAESLVNTADVRQRRSLSSYM